MHKDDPNVYVFQKKQNNNNNNNKKTDVAENLIDKFFSNFDCQRTFS